MESSILIWLGLLGSVWTIFEATESVASRDTKQRISHWLGRRLTARDTGSWPVTFVRLFDDVFGSRHFSVRCFYRSTLTSLAATAIVALIYVAGRWDNRSTFVWNLVGAEFFWYAIVLTLLITVIPDYASLLETRLVIGLMTQTNSITIVALLLILDILLTAAFAAAAAVIYLVVSFSITARPGYGHDFALWTLAPLWLQGAIAFQSETAVWFYPAFFTPSGRGCMP
jgi:hypothetical protein